MSMFMFHQENTAQNHDIKRANKCFENVGVTLTTEKELG